MEQTVCVPQMSKKPVTGRTSAKYGALYFLHKAIARVKAAAYAHRIEDALNEANEIHAGNRPAKTLDQLLHEL